MSSNVSAVREAAVEEIVAVRAIIEGIRNATLPGERLYERMSRVVAELNGAVTELRAP